MSVIRLGKGIHILSENQNVLKSNNLHFAFGNDRVINKYPIKTEMFNVKYVK